ncbi:Transcriptional activator acu-15 [Fusarium acutatum]|uniref:Transcriptional activator acu-15 n=1 Tax=Fusarium acutatum TaxID=78861 RepID=A0A8H4JGP0_9HYPO|nr:Transcriptional activator acu-15 [Fusarium acutatum]
MLPCSSRVPLPLTIDDEYLLETGEGTQPPDSPCRLGLFIYTIRLLEILDKVLKCFYAQDALEGDEQTEMPLLALDKMLTLNSKLDIFLDGLPDYLKLHGGSPDFNTQQENTLLQSRILYCRFLYTRLLLLRPLILPTALSPTCQRSYQKCFDMAIVKRMIQTCQETAHELIFVLHQGLGTVYRCSAWWSVYFTFGAATVLQASMLSNPDDKPKAAIDHSLSTAMEIFNHFTSEVKSSAEAIRVIQSLKDRLRRIDDEAGSPMSRKGPHDTQAPTEASSHNFASGSLDMGPILDPFLDDWTLQQTLNSVDWRVISDSQE